YLSLPQLLAFFPLRSTRHTSPPIGYLRRIRVFIPVASAPCAAPVTHQDQGLLTSRFFARRLPLASWMPQKTLGSLPCPIVYSVQIAWLPRGSNFYRAHGRGVAQFGHAVAGPLSWLRPGLIRSDGCQPAFPPASGLNPTAGPTSAKCLCRFKGHEVPHHVIT